MGESQIRQVESDLRNAARAVEADRLQGEVKVIHWSDIRNAMERTIAELEREVERRSAELAKARERPKVAVAPGDPAALQMRIEELERELAAATERVKTLEEAFDFLDLAEDFDVTGFSAACEELRALVAEVDPGYAMKTNENLPVSLEIDDMLEQGRRNREELYELRADMLEGRGDLSVVVGMIKLSKDGQFLWRRVKLLKEWTQRLSKVL